MMGVSRKTYYEWERRGLSGLLRELEDQAAGRPPSPNSPKEAALQARLQQMERKLAVAEQTAEIRAVLRAMEKASAKKKRPRSHPSSP